MLLFSFLNKYCAKKAPEKTKNVFKIWMYKIATNINKRFKRLSFFVFHSWINNENMAKISQNLLKIHYFLYQKSIIKS